MLLLLKIPVNTLLVLVLVLVDQDEFHNSSNTSLLFITYSKYFDFRVYVNDLTVVYQ